jgi:hypothetical protein
MKKTRYVFEFTSEYVKRNVRNSDNEKLERPARIVMEIPEGMYELKDMLSEYAEKHIRCVAENP